MMGSRGNSGAIVVGRLFRRIISTTADSTKKNIMLSPITTATTTTTTTTATTRRNFVSATNIVLEKHTMKVPSMGDSITEGTLVEWQAQIGQKVEEDDVLALIETDKVTVDIKATKAGVITKQFGEIDDNVEVGADLYEIDTEGVATVEAAAAPSTTTEEAPAAPSTAEPVAASTPAPTVSSSSSSSDVSSGARIPSINFLGKDGWAAALTVKPEVVVPANYGRLPMSEEEIEALMSGGANLAPELKAYSTNATYI
ncbi:single hybrid motif-containing protein [Fragilariopsis cylindrus CCMP1102]|uniref:Single hybrid motif-containing protein n=1 Tax=Fragilariopsis cylindrus CCMP1102 TaxID=635003 RepID=A0A1E7FK10_9STRA|nr:single hybrid motif-containing protein [Fragilariopsis cylindrus CCMP1102]|eukprot:OEU18492.1 single hybrid motif-containing protein [Fragilariopsis cylindrus CCMP1102]